ncbi:hypothetical protein [Devosia sp.]|uniref:hypothetical protein n=1 Tax=Devosia sp. TaxID=1871048 RepID=UPI002AFE0BE5|nr:hypothetical protein [Devosia sp.]
MNKPFGGVTSADDIVTSVRARLYVIAALVEMVERCSDHNFRNCEEEATVLTAEINAKVMAFLDECAQFLERSDKANTVEAA